MMCKLLKLWGLIDDGNGRYEGGEMKDYKVKGVKREHRVNCIARSKNVKHGKRSTKCEASELERMKLIEVFQRGFQNLELRGKTIACFWYSKYSD